MDRAAYEQQVLTAQPAFHPGEQFFVLVQIEFEPVIEAWLGGFPGGDHEREILAGDEPVLVGIIHQFLMLAQQFKLIVAKNVLELAHVFFQFGRSFLGCSVLLASTSPLQMEGSSAGPARKEDVPHIASTSRNPKTQYFLQPINYFGASPAGFLPGPVFRAVQPEYNHVIFLRIPRICSGVRIV